MITEEDKNLVRRFIKDIFIQHQLNVLEELFAADFTYSSALITESKDLQWFSKTLEQMFTAFPDFKASIESFNCGEDNIAVQMYFSGSLHSDFMGIKANGQKFLGPGLMIFTVANQQIKQINAKLDTADYLSQLKN